MIFIPGSNLLYKEPSAKGKLIFPVLHRFPSFLRRQESSYPLPFLGCVYVVFKPEFRQNVSTYSQTLFKCVCPKRTVKQSTPQNQVALTALDLAFEKP